MKKAKLFLIIFLGLNSCAVIHNKKELIDFKKTLTPNSSLKLNGYYFAEYEYDYDKFKPYPINEYFNETGIKKIKYLSVLFIFEDGFVLNLGGIDGISKYYCAEKETYENTYESAHRTIELMLESQYSKNKRTKRICDFRPTYINNKGLVEINDKEIKIQIYKAEMQNPNKDSFNSYYLYQLNGEVKSDSSFVINSEINYRNSTIRTEKILFKFRKTTLKPNIENYFKENMNQFK